MTTITDPARKRNPLRTLLYAICTLAALFLSFGAAPLYATHRRPKRYIVPGTENDERPRTAAMGYPDGTLRSVRSSGGRVYGGDTINLLIALLDEAEADGLAIAEVVIEYKRIGISVTYATSIETLRTQGQRVLGVSGWELAMPRQLWSIDGQAPEGLLTPRPEPEPAAVQPMLFDFAEPRRMGAY
jgi:hypothetical protein